MNKFRFFVLGMCVLLGGRNVEAESRRTFYTEAKLAALSRNLKAHEWARNERDAIMARADKWVKYDDERLRLLVPPPEAPRDAIVHLSGCPVHGDAVNKIGRYNWIISPDEPYKIRCPVGKEVYPSNDFLAFMRSGFKDRSLLTGPYPDDGRGWQKPGVPKKFWFVAFYAHWAARNFVLGAVEDLSIAYLLSGDPRYAHACAVILWQLADYYPRYNYETQSRYGAEFDPKYNGRLLYHTWECFTVEKVAPAYDAVRPAIEKDSGLAAMTQQSPEEIRTFIENRMLRQMAMDIMDGSYRIQGNYGMHQKGLLRLAAVLAGRDGRPTSEEMAAWVLENKRCSMYSELGLYDALYNLVHRDGYPFESPSYNLSWVHNLIEIAEALEERGGPVIRMPRFRRLLTWPFKMACAGAFTPPLGDSNNMFAGIIGWTPAVCEAGLKYYGEAAFAQALTQTGARPSRDLFRDSLEDEIARAARNSATPVGVASSLLPGVGFATLQSGSEANRTALSIFYGYYVGHAHFDRLHIDLFSHRHSLIPDFGYPETADTYDPRRFGFFAHTLSHNTVMVNARRQEGVGGRLHVFDPGPFVQTLEASAESAYPGVVKLYRRTLMMVEAGPDQAYVVDIFRVRGGRQHDWVAHGTQAEFKSDLALSPVQTQGTLAGADVAYGSFYDDPALRDKAPGTVQYHRYTGSAFQFLFNVQRAALEGVGTATWLLNRPENLFPKRPTKGVALRAHLVGKHENVIVCDGRPQLRDTWPETVKFLLRRRTGEELESVFVTVFEPYKDKPFIESVRALSVSSGEGLPVALEVQTGSERHILFNRLDGAGAGECVIQVGKEQMLTDARCAAFAQDLAHQESGAARPAHKAYLLDGRRAVWAQSVVEGAPAATASVREVDYARGRIGLSEAALEKSRPAGGIAIVENDAHAAAIPAHRVRVEDVPDASSFLVGDDDLCAARFAVIPVDGNKLRSHRVRSHRVRSHRVRVNPPFGYFASPGMTLANEKGEAVGRLKSFASGMLEVEGKGLALEDFPDANGDGLRHVFVKVVGPGDRIILHRSNRMIAK